MKMNPVVHFEMPVEDRQRLVEFYTKVFGWKMEEMGEDMEHYVVATTTKSDEKSRRPETPGAINGGFYDTANKPLGLFRIGETVLAKQIQSNLLNGFLSDDGITVAVPTGRFVLQSGPLLIQRGNPLPLKIQNDEHARRMVAAKTGEGFLFLTVYKEDSVFEGPLLADLPKVIQKINTKENLGIVDAINLDGGSASAFKNAETTLSELTPVGSLFCIK